MSRFSKRQSPLVPFVVPICPALLLAFQVLHLALVFASCHTSHISSCPMYPCVLLRASAKTWSCRKGRHATSAAEHVMMCPVVRRWDELERPLVPPTPYSL